MASIKGITIEIGGNTTKLQDALKGVNDKVYSLNSDLKDLDKALKLDPKNTELLAEKQDVLKKNIQATKEKLDTLKEAQRQMGDYNSLTEEQQKNYRTLSVEITKAESALNSMNKELKESSKLDLSNLKDGLSKIGDVTKKAAEISAAAIATIGTAAIAAGKKVWDLANETAAAGDVLTNKVKKLVYHMKVIKNGITLCS